VSAGAGLAIEPHGERLLLTYQGRPIAALSKRGRERWFGRLAQIREVRLLAMVERRYTDGDEGYRAGYRVEAWEVPVVEVVTEP